VPADPPAIVAVGETVEDEISRTSDAERRLREGRGEPRSRGKPGHVGDDVGRGEGPEIAGIKMDSVKARGGETLAEGREPSGVVVPTDLAVAPKERAGDDEGIADAIEIGLARIEAGREAEGDNPPPPGAPGRSGQGLRHSGDDDILSAGLTGDEKILTAWFYVIHPATMA
jgi:hypothetical protein